MVERWKWRRSMALTLTTTRTSTSTPSSTSSTSSRSSGGGGGAKLPGRPPAPRPLKRSSGDMAREHYAYEQELLQQLEHEQGKPPPADTGTEPYSFAEQQR